MAQRRKSIARRRPVIVYRVEVDESEFRIRAWNADELTHRIDGPMRYENTWSYEGPRFGSAWITNVDTDEIHDLPTGVAELIWRIDDLLRE